MSARGVLLAVLLAGLAAPYFVQGAPTAPPSAADEARPVDALGRIVPAGFAGPLHAAGTPGGRQDTRFDDVLLTVIDVGSGFAPETYKNGDLANTRNPDDLENQTTVWSTALGHNITFLVRMEAGDEPLACDDRFIVEAYIETTAGRLYGYTPGSVDTTPPSGGGLPCQGLPGVRDYLLSFDLDGAPPTVSGTEYPVLLPGFYAVNFNVYHTERPSPTNPSGQGAPAGSILIGFTLQHPEFVLDAPLWRLPESTLRMFTDVGATTFSAHHYQIRPEILPRAGRFDVIVNFPGAPAGATFERIDSYAVRIGPGAEPPVSVPGPLAGPTPLDEAIDKATDLDDRAAVTIVQNRPQLNFTTLPPSRAINMTVRGADFPQPTGPTVTVPYTPLNIVTMHLPASPLTFSTGAASFAVPVSDSAYPIRDLESGAVVPGVPESGATTVTLRDAAANAGGATGRNAGDLFALRPIGFSYDAITEARLSRDPDAQWIVGQFPHVTFGDDVGDYLLLGMIYGGGDEFYGMSLARRGIGLDVSAARIVEGRTGELQVLVSNLADDRDGVLGEAELAITVNLTAPQMPDGSSFSQTIQGIPEGGSRSLTIPVTGDVPGTYSVVFTATSGELTTTQGTTVEIISKERAREENRKWYDLPGPGLPATALLVALLAVALRRRNRAA